MEKLTFKCEKLTTLAMTHFYGRTQIADSRAAPFTAKKFNNQYFSLINTLVFFNTCV